MSFVQKLLLILIRCFEDANDHNIFWNNLQALKRHKEQKNELDIYDMANFIEFFKRLYQSRTLQEDTLSKFQVTA